MNFLLPLAVVAALLLFTLWPLFFRGWKHWRKLVIADTLLILLLGGAVAAWHSVSRTGLQRNEAQAVETVRLYLEKGGETKELLGRVRSAPGKDANERWFRAAKEAAR